jgi:hypothetical protein
MYSWYTRHISGGKYEGGMGSEVTGEGKEEEVKSGGES